MKKGFILSYAAIIVQSVISILYTPVMLRLLGQSDYGLLQLAMSAIAHLGILSFGFSGSYLRFYSGFKAENNGKNVAALNGMYTVIFLCASVLALVCGGVVTAFANVIFSHSMDLSALARLRLLLGIMTVNLALSFPCSIFDSYVISQEKFVFQKLVLIITAFLNPMLTLPVMLMGGKSVGVAACMTALTALKLTIGAVYCIKKLQMTFRFEFHSDIFLRLCAFSFFIFLNTVTDQINWNSDKTILGIFKGSDDVTLYSLGAQFNTYFLTFSYALSSLFSPRAYRYTAEKRSGAALTEFFVRFARLQLSVMGYIFLAMIAAGKPFIRLWSGIDSDAPYLVALILISPLVVTSAQSVGIEIQRAKDMHRFRSVICLIGAVVNAAVSIPLCMKFGAVGCAVGTCACLVIVNIVIMNIYYHTKVGLDMFYFWRKTALFSLCFLPAAVCAALLHAYLPQSIGAVAAGAALLACVYFPPVWFFGIRKEISENGLFS